MKKEYIIAGIIGLAILILNNIPMLMGFVGNRDGMFLGRKPINFPDTYTYIAAIEQARQGKILFTNLYTSERQKSSLFRPSYLFIGTVARATGLSSLAAFHLFRVLLSVVFLVISYRFLGVFFRDAWLRIVGFLILLTSGGLGFLLSDISNPPIDLWLPEANTFLMLAEAPHFILSQILIVSSLLSYLSYRSHNNIRNLVVSAGLVVFLSLEHPYTIIPLFLVITGVHIWTKGSLKTLVVFTLISSTGILPWAYQMHANPGFLAWLSADISRSPGPVSYLLGYGLLVVFAALGAVTHLGNVRAKETKLLFVWIAVTIVLIYIPYAAQRRFIEGFHIPLAILATQGIISIARMAPVRAITLVTLIFSGMMVPTAVMKTVWDARAIRSDTNESYYFHITSDELSAMRWLEARTIPSDVTLSNYFYGNLIPGFTGRSVYVGHPAETYRFDDKIRFVNAFLLEKDEEKARAFLLDNRITYMYLGRNDAMRLYGFQPKGKGYLTRVYEKGGVEIYKVL